MGVVTRDTCQLFPLALIGDVFDPAYRMPFPSGTFHHMRCFADIFVTGETDLIYRPAHKCREIATMGIMTDFAHPTGHRAVLKREFLYIVRLVSMAVITERRITPDYAKSRRSTFRVTVRTGKVYNRFMGIFYLRKLSVTCSTGAGCGGSGISSCRGHEMAQCTDLLVFRGMQNHGTEPSRYKRSFPERVVKNLCGKRLYLLIPLETLNENGVFAFVPDRLGNENILKASKVGRGVDLNHIAIYAVDSDLNPGNGGLVGFEDDIIRAVDPALIGRIQQLHCRVGAPRDQQKKQKQYMAFPVAIHFTILLRSIYSFLSEESVTSGSTKKSDNGKVNKDSNGNYRKQGARYG